MYRIEYLESVVKKDISGISHSDKKKIQKAIEKKIARFPIEFGKPLQYSLKGCRRLRVGDYRIIYTVNERNHAVLIVKIGHRREVYKNA